MNKVNRAECPECGFGYRHALNCSHVSSVGAVPQTKHIKLLQRLRNGDCPRCSKADFTILARYLGGHLQLEGSQGARGVMLLNVLRDSDETYGAIDQFLASLAGDRK